MNDDFLTRVLRGENPVVAASKPDQKPKPQKALEIDTIVGQARTEAEKIASASKGAEKKRTVVQGLIASHPDSLPAVMLNLDMKFRLDLPENKGLRDAVRSILWASMSDRYKGGKISPSLTVDMALLMGKVNELTAKDIDGFLSKGDYAGLAEKYAVNVGFHRASVPEIKRQEADAKFRDERGLGEVTGYTENRQFDVVPEGASTFPVTREGEIMTGGYRTPGQRSVDSAVERVSGLISKVSDPVLEGVKYVDPTYWVARAFGHGDTLMALRKALVSRLPVEIGAGLARAATAADVYHKDYADEFENVSGWGHAENAVDIISGILDITSAGVAASGAKIGLKALREAMGDAKVIRSLKKAGIPEDAWTVIRQSTDQEIAEWIANAAKTARPGYDEAAKGAIDILGLQATDEAIEAAAKQGFEEEVAAIKESVSGKVQAPTETPPAVQTDLSVDPGAKQAVSAVDDVAAKVADDVPPQSYAQTSPDPNAVRTVPTEDVAKAPTLRERLSTKIEDVDAEIEAAKQKYADISWDTGLIGSGPAGINPRKLAAAADIGSLYAKKFGLETAEWVAAMVEHMGEAVRPHLDDIRRILSSKDPDAEIAKFGQATEEAVEPAAPGKSTGLANQQQEREVADAVISHIDPTQGSSAEHWQGVGRRLVDEGAIPDEIARGVARGEVPVTAENFGILLEGKRRKLLVIDDLQRQLELNPGDKGIAKRLADATDDLDEYLNNVQAGKGIWSDAGRALQAGVKVNEGSFADVITRMRRFGEVGDDVAKQVGHLTNEVAERDRQILELNRKLAEERAAGEVGKSASRKSRTFDKEAVRKEIDDILEEFKAIHSGGFRRGSGGVTQGKTRGSAMRLGTEDFKVASQQAVLIKRLAVSYVKLGVAELEDVVVAVQRVMMEKLGIDVDRQVVIDSIAHSEKRTASQLQSDIARITGEAKRNSTTANTRRAIADAQKELSTGLREASAGNVAEQRAVLDEAMKSVKDAQRSAGKSVDEQRRLANEAFKRAERIKNSAARKAYRDWWKAQADILDLKEQLKTKNYRVPTKRETELTAEMEALRNERDVWAGRVRRKVREHQQGRAMTIALATAKEVRGFKLGSDIGTLTRQGLFGISTPKNYAKSIWEGIKAARSEEAVAAWQRGIDNRRVGDALAAPIRRKAGLSLSDTFGDEEEIVIGRLIQKIPGLRRLGGALERFQTVMINDLRAGVFDMGIKAGLTPDELATRASFINNATGRGNWKSVPDSLKILLTSPRYEASRWGLLNELWRNPYKVGRSTIESLRTGKGLSGVDRGALMNIRDMGVTAASVYALFETAELAGYELERDPRSPDFLKLRKGDEVWDVSAGLAPRIRDCIRLWLSVREPNPRDNFGTVLGRMLVRPASPLVRTGVEQGASVSQTGRFFQKHVSPFSGFETEEDAEGWRAFAPLVLVAIDEALREAGPAEAASAGIKEFIGGSVNRYPAKLTTVWPESVSKSLPGLKMPGTPRMSEGDTDEAHAIKVSAIQEYVSRVAKRIIGEPEIRDYITANDKDGLERELSRIQGAITERYNELSRSPAGDKQRKEAMDAFVRSLRLRRPRPPERPSTNFSAE